MNRDILFSDDLHLWLENWLADSGVSSSAAPYLVLLILFLGLLVVSAICFYLIRFLVVGMINAILLKTTSTWDDMLVEHKVFNKAAHIVPAFLFKLLMPFVFLRFERFLPLISKLTDSYIILVVIIVLVAFLKALEHVLVKSEALRDKPVASYFQLLRIIIYIAGSILIMSILLGKSPIYFLSAFGAMTAIILLIFKDTILGLVASVQISANDMVRVGDWVEMPKYNADGDVIAMNLHTVKVQNWDKTITTIPSYYFITDSFKNWRGMEESGGRRIKRAIYINLGSVKFVDPELRERFKRFYLVKDYVERRQQEIEEYNRTHEIDTTELINGRRMTNIGVFRRYGMAYLEKHKRIRQDMPLLVRQLPPQEHGLPLEIYCFTATTAWTEYEEIQSDIFDHLISAARHFDLEVFQAASGKDITLAAQNLGNFRGLPPAQGFDG